MSAVRKTDIDGVRWRILAACAVAMLVALFGTAAVLQVQTQANRRLQQANSKLAGANVREKQRFDLAMEAIKLFHVR